MDDRADRGRAVERLQVRPAVRKRTGLFDKFRHDAETVDVSIDLIEQLVNRAGLGKRRSRRLGEQRRHGSRADEHGERKKTAQTHHPTTAFLETPAWASSTVRKPAARRTSAPSRP